jgi:hypothetical protein
MPSAWCAENQPPGLNGWWMDLQPIMKTRLSSSELPSFMKPDVENITKFLAIENAEL